MCWGKNRNLLGGTFICISKLKKQDLESEISGLSLKYKFWPFKKIGIFSPKDGWKRYRISKILVVYK